MGMSTHIVGIQDFGEKGVKLKAVYEACMAAGLPIPMGVSAHFGHETPDDAGMIVDLENHVAVTVYNDSDRVEAGFEVDISKLPETVKAIRFVNSW